MLIELINTNNIDLTNSQTELCIQNILCAYREGKHIVISDELFLKKLATTQTLGSRNCNSAQNILQRIKELTPLRNRVRYYCKVDMSSVNSGIIRNEVNENFFIVGHNFFDDTSKAQPTKLLCEDINDYKIYEIIADFFKFSRKISGVNINFEIINGGGASTKNNFDQIKSTNRLCFCILDNDKKHPKSKVGSTAGKFNASCNSGLCKYFILESNEVEALIPMEIIREAISQGKLNNSYLFAYDQLNALVNYTPEIKSYFDHKMGITVNSAKSMDEKYQDKFWEIPLASAPNFKRNKCLQKMSCECKTECFAVPGFSSRLLDVGVETLSTISHSNLDRMIPSIMKAEWNDIGEQLFSWGCAISQRARTS